MPGDAISADFETRSPTNIRKGLDRYVSDPGFGVLMLSFRLPDEERPATWHRGPSLTADPTPEMQRRLDALHAHVRAGGRIAGWNVMFEWMVWNFHCVPVLGWPELRLEQLDDTMARAAAHNLPQALGKCAAVLGLPADQQKDKRGKYLIQRLCSPHKPTKHRPGVWVEDQALFNEMVTYCDRDVVVEEGVGRKLRPLTDWQRRVWVLTQKINRRGVPVSLGECQAIDSVVEKEKDRLNKELKELTGGAVAGATKRADLLAWVNERVAAPVDFEDPEDDDAEQDPLLVNMKAATVQAALERKDLPPKVRRALQIRAAVVQTSTAKYRKMMANAADDGTLKGMFVWHGAGTGRWASKGGINCFTGDVEVLTPTGWVRFDQWRGEPVMQWWPDGRLNFCQNPVPVVKQHSGRLVEVEAPMFSATMTPEHRLVFFREGKYRERQAGSLLAMAQSTGLSGVPMGGIWDGVAVSRYTPDEARLMVAIAADATYIPRKTQGATLVFGFRKQRKTDRLKSLLNRLGVPYTERNYAPQAGHAGEQPTTHIAISDSPYTKGFGSWLLELDREALDAVIDEIPHWDGWRHHTAGSLEFCSAKREEVEWVSTALHLSGSGGTVRDYSNDRRVKFQLHARRKGSFTHIPRPTVTERHDSCTVYCVSVESSYILIRRNSKISVVGQCQNFPRPSLDDEGIEQALRFLGTGRHADAVLLWGDQVMDAAVSCLRGVLAAKAGYEFTDADYSSIENRMAAFIAGQDDKLQLFADGLDEYKTFASETLFRVPYAAVTKDQRQFTKPVILGGIFGLGWRGLVAYARQYGVEMTDEQAQVAVKGFRKAYRKVRDCWYACGDASVAAVQNPGTWFPAGDKLSLVCHRNFLWMKLPSGRLISWARPRVEWQLAPWKDEVWVGVDEHGEDVYEEKDVYKEVVTVESIETKTRVWCRHPLIGSSIFQSGVQGAAADVLAEGALNVEEGGYQVVLLAHDEALSHNPIGFGDPDDYGQRMCLPAHWRKDLPLAYEAWRGGRFRK